MKIGLEQEFFLVETSTGLPQIVPNDIPRDGCGWLVEARGQPFYNPTEAVYSLLADVHRINSKIDKLGDNFKLVAEPVLSIPQAIRDVAARKFAKETRKYQNFYGHEHNRVSGLKATAGIHISFTNPVAVTKDNHTTEYNLNFDWPRIFTKLDAIFAKEICESKRRPGFYEVKSNGRVEYRSLPNNINYTCLIEALQKVLNYD